LQISQAKGELTLTHLKDIHKKQLVLHCRIQGWRKVQMVYMPCVTSLLTASAIPEQEVGVNTLPPPSERVGNMALWLPSALPASMPTQLCITCLSPGLLEKEAKL
jgi:hypothetical protein